MLQSDSEDINRNYLNQGAIQQSDRIACRQ